MQETWTDALERKSGWESETEATARRVERKSGNEATQDTDRVDGKEERSIVEDPNRKLTPGCSFNGCGPYQESDQ